MVAVLAAAGLIPRLLGGPSLDSERSPGLYVRTPAGYATLTEAELQKLPVADWEVWYHRAGEPPKPPSHPWGMESAKTREAAERMMRSAQYWEPRCNEILGKGFVNEPIYTHFNDIGPIAIVKRPGVSPHDSQASSLLAKLVSERERASEVLEFLRTAKELDGPVSKILGYRPSTSPNPYAGVGSAVKEYARNVQDSLHQAELMGRILEANSSRLTAQIDASLGAIGQNEEVLRKGLSVIMAEPDLSKIELPEGLNELGSRLVDPRHASSSYVDDNGGWGRSLGEGSCPLNPIDVRNRAYMARFGSPRQLTSSSLLGFGMTKEVDLPGIGITKDVDKDGGGDEPIAILYWQDYHVGAPKYVVEYARLYARDNPKSLDPSKGRSKALHELRSFSSTGFESYAAATPETVLARQREFRSWVRHYASDLSRWITGVQAAAGPPIPPHEIAENAVALKPFAALLAAPTGAFKGGALVALDHGSGTPIATGGGSQATSTGVTTGDLKPAAPAPQKAPPVPQGRSAKAIFKEIEALMPFRNLSIKYSDPNKFDVNNPENLFSKDFDVDRVTLQENLYTLERDGETGEYSEKWSAPSNLYSRLNGQGERQWNWNGDYALDNITNWTFKFADLDPDDIAIDKGWHWLKREKDFVVSTHAVDDDFRYVSPASLGVALDDHADLPAKINEFKQAITKHYPMSTWCKVTIGTLDDKKSIVKGPGNAKEQVNKLAISVATEDDAEKLAKLLKELIRYYQSQPKGD